MLMASNDPALYDLYNSPSRSPFSNVAGLGIGGMNFAGSPESPFASSIRSAPFNRFPPRTGGPRPMRPPGLMQELPPITGGARPMGPPGRDFQAELQTLSRPSRNPKITFPFPLFPPLYRTTPVFLSRNLRLLFRRQSHNRQDLLAVINLVGLGVFLIS